MAREPKDIVIRELEITYDRIVRVKGSLAKDIYRTVSDLNYQTVNRVYTKNGKTLIARYYLQIQGLKSTTEALDKGMLEGWEALNYLVLSELQDILRSFIEGRMRNLGLNRQGRFLSKGKRPKYYNRYARLPPAVRISGAKLKQGGVTSPIISAFMNMGDRNTNTNNRVGAPHSVFVEYGFTDRAGRKHSPRPIFKLARANMPAMKALAVSQTRNKAVAAISNAVMSKLKTYK